MATPKSTTRYSDSPNPEAPSALREQMLEFPDGRDFKPLINRRAPDGFLDFCASYLPRLRERSDYRQRRLERCCDVEFDLYHPERVPDKYPAGLVNELLDGV